MQDALGLVSLLRPPVLVHDPEHDGGYLAIANVRVVEWLRLQADASNAPDSPVLSLIVGSPDFDISALVMTEQYLMPLVLGSLSKREEREARRQLKIAGNTRLSPISIRARLKPIRRQ